ncbi:MULTISPECIES: cytochrome ubiquinol oxidase subunit I [Paenibacillus]|uniref:Cytochrome ubiquinol oxidase subunit I n=1 Tax=Paenibacillus campinasensis TaxID=66347 RepID=A0A268EMT0_9BACL|nr:MULTISPECIES: cytochrome ubiquinol oxidase subunit I [Paenibacillus]MUG66985.1 cytochrome ubiquinol oxidase subunit I [Paenibacillus campinasensis]PAD74426.1 cytochrome ubiquinol oxidase subunit I [Paenibacillus campinasensis]PAK50824.1 cytochrome ubiquinol oxidase subunit I [Paenibacillus sp. 7541]
MSFLDPVLMSRILFGLTLFVHIVFATIGVGIPIMLALAEWRGIRTGDFHYTLLARRWARGYVITVAVGVVTGTAIGLQLSLLWPTFMRVAGKAIALPLFMETFAFFVEAIFLGIYLYTWDRFKNKAMHLLLLIPVAIGSSASAFFITSMNAFMNQPQGFELVDGVFTNVNPFVAMFNPATPTKVSHVLASAYTTSAGALASIAAFSLLRGRTHVYFRKALKLSVIATFVFAIATVTIGDFSGKFLAKYQPEKLAAMEWHFETMRYAPLIYGGVLDEDHNVRFGLEIPYALSILAGNNPATEVIGLNDFPEDERPPLSIHYYFDLKVTIGMLIVLIPLLYMFRKKLPGKKPYPKWLLLSILALGPLTMSAIWLGWFLAEIGRQPWILRGYMKVEEAATTSPSVGWMLVLFILLYLVLCVSAVRVLSQLFRNRKAEEEIEAQGLEIEGGDGQ